MLLTDADQLREALAIALRERDEARAEVERLKADNSVMGNYWSFAAALRDVAERQREADIDHCLVWLGHANVGVPLDQFMRETPLVTEGDK